MLRSVRSAGAPAAQPYTDARARVAGHESLTDQNAPLRVFKDVVGLSDTRLCDRNDVLRDDIDDLLRRSSGLLEGLQVTCD